MSEQNPYQPSQPSDPTTSPAIHLGNLQFPYDFPRKSMTVAKCVGLFAFSGLSIVMGLLMFGLHLFVIAGNNPLMLHASSTLPIIMGVFAFIGGWSLLSTPEAVRVWAEGLEIVARPPQLYSWKQIASIYLANNNTNWGPAKSLRLLDRDGKPIATIGGAIEQFDVLVEFVRAGIGQHAEQIVPGESKASPTKAALKSGRRNAIITGIATCIFIPASVFMFYDAWWKHHSQQRMASESVAGQGTVVRHFVAPNGRTKRIEYEAEGKDGVKQLHNVEVNEVFHRQVNVGDSVEIQYVPDDPRVSRLQSGEIISDDFTDTPLANALLGCAGVVFSIFMGAMSVIQWKGYDVKFKDGKLRAVPFGT